MLVFSQITNNLYRLEQHQIKSCHADRKRKRTNLKLNKNTLNSFFHRIFCATKAVTCISVVKDVLQRDHRANMERHFLILSRI